MAYCPLMCCMYATYGVIQPNRDGAMERTRQKLLMTSVTFISNDHSDLDLWLFFDLEMDHNTLLCHGLYLCQVQSRLVKQAQSHGADTTKVFNDPCRVGFLPEETYFFRDTRKKVEETYFFQFCPDKTGRNWTKLEKTVKDVRNAGKHNYHT